MISDPIAPLIYLCLSFTVCVTLLFFMLRLLGKSFLPDQANHRSLHQGVIPRFGGVAIVLAVVVAFTISSWVLNYSIPLPANSLFWPAAIIFVLALTDDWRSLDWWLRFPIQTLAAYAAIAALTMQLPWWCWFLAMLATQWSTNLFNFMDGMDGLAGMMGAVGFGALWLASGHQDTLSLTLVGACLGFLVFNRYPARVFMGDSGSTTLGMLAAAISINGIHNGSWLWPIPVLIFLPFVYDATSTLLLRVLARKRVWQAHREHMYQRAVLAGYSVQAVWQCSMLLMLMSAGSALLVKNLSLAIQSFTLLCACSGLALLQRWLYQMGRKTTETSQ